MNKPTFLFAFILLLVLSCTKNQESPSSESTSTEESASADTANSYQADYITNFKTELVMVVISSEGCGVCTLEENQEVVRKIKNEFAKKANSLGIGFLSIGVSLDWDVDTGYKHLRNYGNFDEVLIGNNWLGTGGLKYIFDDIPGTPAVPQVVLTKRIYDVDADSLSGQITGLISGVEKETLISREYGLNTLKDWLDAGLPTPDF